MAVRPQPKVRLKDRRRRAWMWRSASVGILVVGFLVGAWFVVRLPEVTVSAVRVEGTQVIDATAVQTSVEKMISGSYLWLVPKHMSLIIPTAATALQLEKQFPQAATIVVHEENASTLVVTVTERGPEALWCAGDATCYDMDKTGFIFQKDTTASSTLRSYLGSVQGSPVGIVFLDGVFPSLEGFIDSAEVATHRHITKVTIGDGSDVFATFAEGGELRFVMTTNTAPTLQNIASVFASTAFQNSKQLQYADFRFGSRAEIKFAP